MLKGLVESIIINQHPFTIVEELKFIDYIHIINPDAVLILADTIKRKIMNLYTANIDKMQESFQDNFFYFRCLDYTFLRINYSFSITSVKICCNNFGIAIYF